MVVSWISVDDLEDPTSPHAAEAVSAASFVLFNLSGRKYSGVHTTTEVYCQIGLDGQGHVYPSTLNPGGGGARVYPTLWDGQIINQIGGSCGTCGCPHLIRLRGTPVLSVQALSVGARSFADDEITVYDYSYIAAGSGRCWSSCDDVTVTYTYGSPPPSMGKIAARAMANQYVWAMADDDRCALPQRVTQVSRQGMSWTLLDPQTFLSEGLTGIYQVDLFLRTVNPDKARMRARVFSPDIPRARTPRTGASGWGTDPLAPLMMMVGGSGSTPSAPPASTVVVYAGRALRWVVPGSFGDSNPPMITIDPGGVAVPEGSVVWRSANYTLDLTAEQVSTLLGPYSSLVVSPDGSTEGAASYSVEWRTA